MHELTLCYQTHELIVQQASAQKAERIVAVWLEIGALSCVELESLKFCFDLVCQETIADGCQLNISQQTASAWCDDCKKNVSIKNAFIATCSLCGKPLIKVDADDKVWVKKIQVE